MPTLTLFTDLTLHAPYTLYACTLHKNYAGTQFPTYNFAIPNLLQRNLFFWNYQPSLSEKLDDISILPSFKPIKDKVIKNEDVLISSNIFGLEKHKNIVQLIKHDLSLQKYDIQAVFHIGRFDLTYEFQMRIYENIPQKEKIWAILESYNEKIVEILNLYEEALGKENVKIIWDNSSVFNSRCISKEISNVLDITLPTNPPPHISNFATHKARQLWKIIFDLCVAYPSFELAALAEKLKKYEEISSWEEGYVSSKSVREKIHQNTLSFYEQIRKYFPDDYVFNFSLAIENSMENVEDLTSKDFQLFFNFLDKNTLYALYEDLNLYERVLSDMQKIFLNALRRHILIIKKNKDIFKEKPKLAVLTLCFNHEKYITKCIKSIQSQQTDFPIVHIILDHASYDKSQEVIIKNVKKYDNIIPFLCNARIGNGYNVKTLFSLADTPYVAICDGDDYFTDPYKLQKQVDLLERNPNCSLCFHQVQVLCENERDKDRLYPSADLLPRGGRSFYYFADLLKINMIQTNSVVYRWRFQKGLPEWFRPDIIPGDWYWHLLHAENGKIGFINEVMSVYLRHTRSLYKEVEYENVVKHRLVHGMNELEAFDVINTHFKNKYITEIEKFSTGVFANYLEYYTKTGDDSFLNKAIRAYPHFAKNFLNSLKNAKNKEKN